MTFRGIVLSICWTFRVLILFIWKDHRSPRRQEILKWGTLVKGAQTCYFDNSQTKYQNKLDILDFSFLLHVYLFIRDKKDDAWITKCPFNTALLKESFSPQCTKSLKINFFFWRHEEWGQTCLLNSNLWSTMIENIIEN